jgi:DNA-binding transcriptional LysR family regulator
MRTPIDYQLLSIFIAVADETSFSKAARKLGIGKGTVSRAIANLEALVGAELLHRNTHAVALSTAGIALYERTAQHLHALDQAVLKLPERAEEPSGELRITAPLDVGRIVLPDVLAQFSRRYPEIRFHLHITNQQVDLVAEGFDLAIRAAPSAMKNSNLTARKIGGGSIGFWASPAYVARRGKPKHLGDAGHDWILPPQVFAHLKFPKETTCRFLCDDFFLIRELVRDGAGVGVIPSFVAEPYVQEGLLEVIPMHEVPPWTGGLFIVYPSSGQVPRKVIVFRDFLVERLKKSPLE